MIPEHTKNEWADIFRSYKRVVIIGFPRVGKTEFCEELKDVIKPPIIHTDDLIEHGWNESLDHLCDMTCDLHRYVIEGVLGYRFIRRMVREDQTEPDLVVIIDPRYPVEEKHKTMRKTLTTILNSFEMHPTTKVIRTRFPFDEIMEVSSSGIS